MLKEIILVISMWIVTVCTYISYVPQIVKLIRTRKSEDLSVVSWVLWFITALADLVYSIVLGRTELIIASISEFLLITLTLVLTCYYEYRNNFYLEPEEAFQERLNRIKAKDGNHMVLVTAILKNRERIKENRSKVRFLKDK